MCNCQHLEVNRRSTELYHWHLHHQARSPLKRKTSERREVPFPFSAEAAASETIGSVHNAFQQNMLYCHSHTNKNKTITTQDTELIHLPSVF